MDDKATSIFKSLTYPHGINVIDISMTDEAASISTDLIYHTESILWTH